MTSDHDKTCPECKGEGETWSVAGRRYKCQQCDGTGKAPAKPLRCANCDEEVGPGTPENAIWCGDADGPLCSDCHKQLLSKPAEPGKPKSITQRIWDECVAERQGAKKKCIELGNYIRAELSLDETDWAALVDILMEKYDDGYILFPA